MRVFSPGWNSTPVSRGETGVRLYDSFQPGLKLATKIAPKFLVKPKTLGQL